MKAILLIPNDDSGSRLFGTPEATLIDRPFLRHVIEFIVDQGIRRIELVGSARAEQAMASEAKKARAIIGRAWEQ